MPDKHAPGPGPFTAARGKETKVAANDKAKDAPAETKKDEDKPKSPFEGITSMLSGEAMGPMIAASTKSMYLAKADKLAARLKLSPEQKESLAKFMAAQAKEETERTTKMLGMMKDLKDNPTAVFTAEAGLPKSDTKEHMRQWAAENLTPEQQENLKRYSEDRRTANAEKIAQARLDQLNETLDLDESQRDKLFQHYAREALANGTAGDDVMDDNGMFRGEIAVAGEMAGEDPATPDPLAEILTPEQMTTYREHQKAEEQRSIDMMKSLGLDPAQFGGKEGGAKVLITPTVINGQ